MNSKSENALDSLFVESPSSAARSEDSDLTLWLWCCFGWTTLLGAFLVFQVQPIISKCVLPWFGGTPAVWTTCLLFFQCVLFFGYLYAHLIKTYLPPKFQAIVHLLLLSIAAFMLPIEPSVAWKPVGGETPVLHLLTLLAVHVGLPYFVLSSTGPLLQAWFSFHNSSNQVYRLYALSNVGSLLALLTYPFLIEPVISVHQQSLVWSLGFCAFVLFQGLLAIRLFRVNRDRPQVTVSGTKAERQDHVPYSLRFLWLALPAFASTMLLVVTDHVSQDVAVIPFLWVLPLSLYLISFIVSFDSPRWYLPKSTAAATLVAMGVIYGKSIFPANARLIVEATAYMVMLLGICLLCHGEVARIKPSSRLLTAYYVALSAGGAVGGLIVAVVCPFVFTSHFELPLAMALTMLVAITVFFAVKGWTVRVYDWNRTKRIVWVASAVVLLPVFSSLLFSNPNTIASQRNFFGVLRVEKFPRGTRLVHGNTIHGMQLSQPHSLEPTTYYGRNSGVALAWHALQSERPSMDIGIVGLGCGVLAVYGRPEDRMELMEINPAIIDIARNQFTFLQNCSSQWETSLGDGRLLLESSPSNSFDFLVLDAFSSDAIPAHLLTVEAFSVYKSRLKTDGVLAIHLSNNHLDLVPLAHNLAKHAGLESRVVKASGDANSMTMHSTWMIISDSSHPIWNSDELANAEAADTADLTDAPLWTDQEHNLASVLKLW